MGAMGGRQAAGRQQGTATGRQASAGLGSPRSERGTVAAVSQQLGQRPPQANDGLAELIKGVCMLGWLTQQPRPHATLPDAQLASPVPTHGDQPRACPSAGCKVAIYMFAFVADGEPGSDQVGVSGVSSHSQGSGHADASQTNSVTDERSWSTSPPHSWP